MSHDKWDRSSSKLSTIDPYASASLYSSLSTPLISDSLSFPGSLAPETFIHPNPTGSIGLNADHCLGPYQDKVAATSSVHSILDMQYMCARSFPIYGSPPQGTRAQDLLDVRDWSQQSPGYGGLPLVSDGRFLSTSMSSAASHFHSDKALIFDPTPLIFASAEGITNAVGDERHPVVIYRSPEKKGSGRRRSRRARAINVEGIWIDEEDFYSAQGRTGILSVHECQWAKSSNPCGMWIVGSRSHVGAHIDKWHGRRRASSHTSCLWDGCTKTMLRDSINRHVVTVHLREGFLCQGCDQEFSRKDVYDDHVKEDDACRDAGAVMVYGAEPRVINTSRMLHSKLEI